MRRSLREGVSAHTRGPREPLLSEPGSRPPQRQELPLPSASRAVRNKCLLFKPPARNDRSQRDAG